MKITVIIIVGIITEMHVYVGNKITVGYFYEEIWEKNIKPLILSIYVYEIFFSGAFKDTVLPTSVAIGWLRWVLGLTS